MREFIVKRRAYIPLLIFLWAVVPCYYFTKNSFPKESYAAVTFLQSIITLIILNFSAYFLGGAVFRAIRINTGRFNLKGLYKIAAGFGIIFISLLFLGMSGLYTPIYLNLYIILLAVFSIFGICEFVRELPAGTSFSFTGTQTALISLTAFVIMLDLIVTLVPPTVRDSLIHHLAVPKIYLKEGGIAELSFMTFSFRSINLELLYVLALFIKNDIIARVMHFNFYLLSLIALYYFLKDSFSKNTSLIGVLIFASTPVVFNTASSAYVDLGLTFFCIMLFSAVFWYHKTGDNVYIILGGMMAGLAISSKLNGYLFALLAFLWLVSIIQREKQPLKRLLINACIFFMFAFIFDSHLIVKNTVQTGNPFHPVLSLAKGETYQADDAEKKLLPVEVRKLLYNHTWVDELMMPWALSTEVKSKALYTVDGVLGPLFVIFIPFIFLIKRRRYELYSSLAIAGVYTAICWGMFNVRLRYLMVLFPICVFLISAVIEEFFCNKEESNGALTFAKGLLACILLFNVTLNIYHICGYVSIKEPFEFLTAKITREQYLAKHYKQYGIFKYINENITDEDALIYFLDFGNDGYYCDVDYIYDSTFLGRTFEAIVKESKSGDGVYERLKDKGITHILLNEKYLKEDISNNYSYDEEKNIYDFFTEHTDIFKRFGEEAIYKIAEQI
jgi:4-amino-4-deoxy-L-arabinose transferase-like glycosyltransferase